MDNIEKAKKWFKDIFKGCYIKKLEEYPNWVFWIYDKNLARQKKLSKITGVDMLYLNMSKGELIFQQSIEFKKFYIRFSDCWSFLETNFNLEHNQVEKLTSDVVNEILNYKQYITDTNVDVFHSAENKILNCEKYTTDTGMHKTMPSINKLLKK